MFYAYQPHRTVQRRPSATPSTTSLATASSSSSSAGASSSNLAAAAGTAAPPGGSSTPASKSSTSVGSIFSLGKAGKSKSSSSSNSTPAPPLPTSPSPVVSSSAPIAIIGRTPDTLSPSPSGNDRAVAAPPTISPSVSASSSAQLSPDDAMVGPIKFSDFRLGSSKQAAEARAGLSPGSSSGRWKAGTDLSPMSVGPAGERGYFEGPPSTSPGLNTPSSIDCPAASPGAGPSSAATSPALLAPGGPNVRKGSLTPSTGTTSSQEGTLHPPSHLDSSSGLLGSSPRSVSGPVMGSGSSQHRGARSRPPGGKSKTSIVNHAAAASAGLRKRAASVDRKTGTGTSISSRGSNRTASNSNEGMSRPPLPVGQSQGLPASASSAGMGGDGPREKRSGSSGSRGTSGGGQQTRNRSDSANTAATSSTSSSARLGSSPGSHHAKIHTPALVEDSTAEDPTSDDEVGAPAEQPVRRSSRPKARQQSHSGIASTHLSPLIMGRSPEAQAAFMAASPASVDSVMSFPAGLGGDMAGRSVQDGEGLSGAPVTRVGSHEADSESRGQGSMSKAYERTRRHSRPSSAGSAVRPPTLETFAAPAQGGSSALANFFQRRRSVNYSGRGSLDGEAAGSVPDVLSPTYSTTSMGTVVPSPGSQETQLTARGNGDSPPGPPSSGKRESSATRKATSSRRLAASLSPSRTRDSRRESRAEPRKSSARSKGIDEEAQEEEPTDSDLEGQPLPVRLRLVPPHEGPAANRFTGSGRGFKGGSDPERPQYHSAGYYLCTAPPPRRRKPKTWPGLGTMTPTATTPIMGTATGGGSGRRGSLSLAESEVETLIEKSSRRTESISGKTRTRSEAQMPTPIFPAFSHGFPSAPSASSLRTSAVAAAASVTRKAVDTIEAPDKRIPKGPWELDEYFRLRKRPGLGRPKTIRYHGYPRSVAPYWCSYDAEALMSDLIVHKSCKDVVGSHSLLSWEQGPPTRVLDVGTGTGAWCTDLAREWPQAEFIGLDLVPVQTRIVDEDLKERVSWVVANVLEGLPFPDHSFDLVHMRNLGATGIPEDKWDFVMGEMVRVLAPFGQLELLESDSVFYGNPVDVFASDLPELVKGERSLQREFMAQRAKSSEGGMNRYDAVGTVIARCLQRRFVNAHPLSVIPGHLFNQGLLETRLGNPRHLPITAQPNIPLPMPRASSSKPAGSSAGSAASSSAGHDAPSNQPVHDFTVREQIGPPLANGFAVDDWEQLRCMALLSDVFLLSASRDLIWEEAEQEKRAQLDALKGDSDKPRPLRSGGMGPSGSSNMDDGEPFIHPWSSRSDFERTWWTWMQDMLRRSGLAGQTEEKLGWTDGSPDISPAAVRAAEKMRKLTMGATAGGLAGVTPMLGGGAAGGSGPDGTDGVGWDQSTLNDGSSYSGTTMEDRYGAGIGLGIGSLTPDTSTDSAVGSGGLGAAKGQAAGSYVSTIPLTSPNPGALYPGGGAKMRDFERHLRDNAGVMAPINPADVGLGFSVSDLDPEADSSPVTPGGASQAPSSSSATNLSSAPRPQRISLLAVKRVTGFTARKPIEDLP